MHSRLELVFSRSVDVEEKPFTATIHVSCFSLTISAAENLDGGATVELSAAPEVKGGYELVVDYKFVVGEKSVFIERDKWRDEEKLQVLTSEGTNVTIQLSVGVRQILAPQDLSASTSFRNMHILTSEKEFYVNATQLKDLGGRLFKDWYERDCQGETSIVVLSLDSKELKILLECCCAYTTPTIHRRNLDDILAIAEREKIVGLLRLAETFLIESESIHPVRKLEYAAEFRMSRLADFVLRSFKSRIARLDSLFEYLSQNGESLEQVHADVLTMLEIHSNFIVI